MLLFFTSSIPRDRPGWLVKLAELAEDGVSINLWYLLFSKLFREDRVSTTVSVETR